MNIKRIGLCILALIVVGLSYWLAVGGNYDSKTVRIDPEEHTLVNSSDAIISKRILAMKSSHRRPRITNVVYERLLW